ncbi:activity-regulated cytoskeleton-associated protein-like [Phoenix dactylifera]|uniref:Activity-regulated cytoskeleton-associated protein-like n=1 Tax=Phoenix dactylifera TaxID=42345 RepID=A0A8B9ANU0_PHODC|nr:activity-regulated cytoskeleton-associated protein-like [Phoenix dactylifera]
MSEPVGSPHPWRPHGRHAHEGRREERVNREGDARGFGPHERGLPKPKIEFPSFGGGDPYEWLDKVEQYFHVYEIPREERVTLASYHLEGRANRWWRWLRNIYEKERNYLGWTTFVQEFMNQWGPSPTVNHHGQLAKLKQEGKVQAYIDEFRQLQTMVEGWPEEALLGTFVDRLKPWLSKEIKLKQPTRLQEAMRMAEILDQANIHD